LARSTATNQPSEADHLFNEQFQQILRTAAVSLADRQSREQTINDQASAGEFTALMTLRRKVSP
jgi:hypothetical protein